RSVQSPVRCVIASMGLAPRSALKASHTSNANGSRQSAKTTPLAALIRFRFGFIRKTLRRQACAFNHRRVDNAALRTPIQLTLEELAQVHPRVQMRHLLGVTVERQGLALEELPDAPFPFLAPARVVHLWIHVGIEPVLARRRPVPGSSG